MKDVSSLLHSLGFTDSEFKTYLAALENGSSTVIELTKLTRLSRQTTYLAIETLVNQGLMSSFHKKKKTLYSAESPERLFPLMELKRQEIEAAYKDAESIISDLKLVQRGEKPVVRLLEGREGLKAIQDDVLNTNPDILYELNNVDRLYSLFPKDDFSAYQDGLKKKNILRETIVSYSKPITQNFGSSIKIYQVSTGQFPFSGNILIYKDKVSLSSLQGKNISVLIESEIIAQTMKALFRMAIAGVKQ